MRPLQVHGPRHHANPFHGGAAAAQCFALRRSGLLCSDSRTSAPPLSSTVPACCRLSALALLPPLGAALPDSARGGDQCPCGRAAVRRALRALRCPRSGPVCSEKGASGLAFRQRACGHPHGIAAMQGSLAKDSGNHPLFNLRLK